MNENENNESKSAQMEAWGCWKRGLPYDFEGF